MCKFNASIRKVKIFFVQLSNYYANRVFLKTELVINLSGMNKTHKFSQE